MRLIRWLCFWRRTPRAVTPASVSVQPPHPDDQIGYRWSGPAWVYDLFALMACGLFPVVIYLGIHIVDNRPVDQGFVVTFLKFMGALAPYVGAWLWVMFHYDLYRPVAIYRRDLDQYRGPLRWRRFRAQYCWKYDPARDRPPAHRQAPVTTPAI